MYSLLYVDDEESLLELAKIFLERTDSFSVTTKISAREGLDALKNGSFDAIISDYAMPGIDGIEFLKMVRAENPTLPFLLFTGKGREEVAIEAIDSGADFYIQKGGEPKAQFAELALTFADQHRIARPYKKNEQSFIERFNLTVRQECLGWEKYAPHQIHLLQQDILTWLDYYHFIRPSMAFEPMHPPLSSVSHLI